MSTPTHREALEALRADALEIFDDPECPQAVRDAIEWYHSSILAALSRPEPQAGEAVAIVKSYTSGSYHRNYKLEWLLDVPEGTKLFAHPPAGEAKLREALEKAFAAGWRTAANWMGRDDLVADIGSLAYMKDREAALSAEQKGGANG